MTENLPAGEREFLLYLPLYNGVTSVELGLPEGARLAQAPAYRPERKPIVFYGTSITQGACASRTGMPYPAILGRRLGFPVINLGFSGAGKMEAAMAALLAELDPAVYVIDCVPNMGSGEMNGASSRSFGHCEKLRPETPILLIEGRIGTNAFIRSVGPAANEVRSTPLSQAYDRLVADGVQGLVYLEGADQLGTDGEATVDGSHPTDLGFMHKPTCSRRLSNRC